MDNRITNDSKATVKRFLGDYNIKDSKYLKKLYSYLNNNYTKDNVDYKSETKENINYIHVENPYISKNILNHIKHLKNRTQVEFNIRESVISLDIYHNEKNINKFLVEITKYIKYMYDLTNYKKNIKFIYYLTNCKKTVKKQKNHIFTVDEINSGSSSTNGIITIWRKEEVLKTTLHELIHQMDLDYRSDNIEIINYYKTNYRCSSDNMNTYEGYTDFWAIIINIFLCSKLLNNPYDFFKEMLNVEIAYTLYQCQKIIYLCQKNPEWTDYNKHTNIIAYYFIKCSLFLSLNKSLKFFIDNNHNIFKIKDINKYFKYLETLPLIKPNNRRFNKSFINSMRMSVCDIELF